MTLVKIAFRLSHSPISARSFLFLFRRIRRYGIYEILALVKTFEMQACVGANDTHHALHSLFIMIEFIDKIRHTTYYTITKSDLNDKSMLSATPFIWHLIRISYSMNSIWYGSSIAVAALLISYKYTRGEHKTKHRFVTLRVCIFSSFLFYEYHMRQRLAHFLQPDVHSQWTFSHTLPINISLRFSWMGRWWANCKKSSNTL